MQNFKTPLTFDKVDTSSIKLLPLHGRRLDIDYLERDELPLESPFLRLSDQIRDAKQPDFLIMHVSIQGEDEERAAKFQKLIQDIEIVCQNEIKKQAPKVGDVTFKTIIQHKKDNPDLIYRLVLNKKDKELFIDEHYRSFDYRKLTTKHLVKFILVIKGVFFEPSDNKKMGLEFEVHRVMVKNLPKKKKSVRYMFNEAVNANSVETEFMDIQQAIEDQDDDNVQELNHHDDEEVKEVKSALDEIEINLSDIDD